MILHQFYITRALVVFKSTYNLSSLASWTLTSVLGKWVGTWFCWITNINCQKIGRFLDIWIYFILIKCSLLSFDILSLWYVTTVMMMLRDWLSITGVITYNTETLQGGQAVTSLNCVKIPCYSDVSIKFYILFSETILVVMYNILLTDAWAREMFNILTAGRKEQTLCLYDLKCPPPPLPPPLSQTFIEP